MAEQGQRLGGAEKEINTMEELVPYIKKNIPSLANLPDEQAFAALYAKRPDLRNELSKYLKGGFTPQLSTGEKVRRKALEAGVSAFPAVGEAAAGTLLPEVPGSAIGGAALGTAAEVGARKLGGLPPVSPKEAAISIGLGAVPELAKIPYGKIAGKVAGSEAGKLTKAMIKGPIDRTIASAEEQATRRGLLEAGEAPVQLQSKLLKQRLATSASESEASILRDLKMKRMEQQIAMGDTREARSKAAAALQQAKFAASRADAGKKEMLALRKAQEASEKAARAEQMAKEKFAQATKRYEEAKAGKIPQENIMQLRSMSAVENWMEREGIPLQGIKREQVIDAVDAFMSKYRKSPTNKQLTDIYKAVSKVKGATKQGKTIIQELYGGGI